MLSFKKVFPRAAANVIGMVHALPMPATPLYEGAKGVEAIVERATAEAKLYSGTNNLWMISLKGFTCHLITCFLVHPECVIHRILTLFGPKSP